MVKSKFVVLQMIPHTLFIESDFWTLFTSCFTVHDTVRYLVTVHDTVHTVILLFMELFTSRFTVH